MKIFQGASYCPVLLVFSAMLILPELAFAEKHTPPKKPRVLPRIGMEYPHDKDKDRLEDNLKEKADKAKTDEERNRLVEVNLVFTEQITQGQIDAFEKEGGEIDHIYQTISYGWNGRCPLKLVDRLPKLLGDSMILLEEAKEMKAHMINATKTGRARAIWANNFGGSATGYDGSTNITIGIIDSGVDGTHTDLAGRQVFWKDYSTPTNLTALDYSGHGTHVAGIALGTGAAAGSATGPFSFTLANTLTNLSSGRIALAPVAFPATSLTWISKAQWTGGGATTNHLAYWPAGPFGSITSLASSTGNSALTTTSTFTPSTANIYQSLLPQSNTTNGVTDYVITNYISSYPAVGDGFNKFRGVAPGCNWAGARVMSGATGSFSSSAVNSALDDMVTGRIANKIKVINLSLGVVGSPGTNYTLRQYVNAAVANGIIAVVAAGNDGSAGGTNSAAREIDDPGRAAYAITVGANNGVNQLTAYSSVGFTNAGTVTSLEEDYKPDLMAPGGSSYYGLILAPDSNTQDGNFSDVNANDYTAEMGTSMAAPFVSGAAALVIDAIEQNGHTWDFNSTTDPLYVKMLLCGTATEANANRESGTNNPTLQRAGTDGTGYPSGKDQFEGYGLMNPDAAIEAAIITFTNNTTLNSTFGGTVVDRRAWARKVFLNGGQNIVVNLTTPAGSDFDLYLYSATPGTYGKPTLLASSTSSTTGATESINYTATGNGENFLVVKRVSGSGTFSIQMTSSANNNFSNGWTLSGPSGTGTGDNTAYTSEASEPSFSSGEGKTAWYFWNAPFSGSARFTVNNNHILKLYTGASVSTLSQATGTVLIAGDVNTESYYVSAGATYRLKVDSTFGSSGPFTVSYVYDSVTSATFTNTARIITPENDTASPYPSTITVPSLSGNLVKVTATLVNFSNYTAGSFDVILVSPNNTVTYLMSDCGSGGSMTAPATLTFSDDAATSLNSGSPITGTYKPTCLGGGSFPSPAPSGTYYTNLAVFNSQSVGGTWSLYVVGDASPNSACGGIAGGWTLSLTMDQVPAFAMDTSSITYVENAAATQLSGYCIITDGDSSDFNGGNLTVQFSANGASEDRLTVLPEGTSSGQIGVSGNVISYGGLNIGSYTGGTSGSSPLVVTFTNTSANLNAVQRLVTRVAYTNVSEAPSTATRTVMFSINDGDGATNSATKNISVTSVNDAPILTTINTLSGAVINTPFTIAYTNLAAVADESDDSATIYFRIESIMNGTLTMNGTNVSVGTLIGTNDSVVWTPSITGTPVAAFMVKAFDGVLASSAAIAVNVNVTVFNSAPTLTTVNTLTGALEDAPFTVTYAALAAAADEADAENNPISFRVESVASGTLTQGGLPVTNGVTLLSINGNWVWTPAANVNGAAVAAFTVRAWDGVAASATAIPVSVTVSNVNDAPTLTSIGNFSGAIEDNAVGIPYEVLASGANEADIDGDTISFRVESYTGILVKNNVAVTNGVTLLSAGEVWVWVPPANTNGNAITAFTVKAWDGAGASATAIAVTINVAAVNDAPTLTSVSTLTGAVKNTPFTISHATLAGAANEADVDGDSLSFRVQAISSGTLTKNGTNVVAGSTLVATNESLVWTPATDVTGAAVSAFTVVAWDGALASTSPVQVSVAVSEPLSLTMYGGAQVGSTSAPSLAFINTNLVALAANFGGSALTRDGVTFSAVAASGNPMTNVLNNYAIALSSPSGSLSSATFGDALFGSFIWASSQTPMTLTLDGLNASKAYKIYYLAGDDRTMLFNMSVDLVATASTNSVANTATMSWGGLSPGPQNYIYLPTFVSGATTATATMNTIAGSSGVGFSGVIVVENSAPTLSAITTLTNATEDTGFAISHSALAIAADESDADSDALSFRIETLSSGTLKKNGTNIVVGSTLLSTNESLVWTPATNVNGSALAAFTVRSWDGGLASASPVQVNINVAAVNDSPVVANAIPDQSAAYGQAFTYTFPTNTFADVDSTLFTYAVSSGVPSGISFSPGTRTLTGTPTQSGTYNVGITATDNGVPTLSVTNLFNLVVAKGAISVTPSNASRQYGQINPVLSGAINGIVNGDSISAVYSTTATTNQNVGVVAITAILVDGGNRLTNYTAVTNSGILTVTQAPLAVTVNSASRVYGATNPILTGTIGGIRNNDDITATFSTTATTNSLAGTYPITVTLVDPNTRLGNYSVTTNAGTLTITNLPNYAPTLTSVRFLGRAKANVPFTISYAMLAAAADEADVNGDAISFRVENIVTGTLTKNGTNVSSGTLLSSGENLVWTAPASANSTAFAFTVKAWDGALASTLDAPVTIAVASTNRSLVLSRETSTNGLGDIVAFAGGNNLVGFQGDTVDAALGQTFSLTNGGAGTIAWQITSLSLVSQGYQTLSSNAVWKLTLVNWEPSADGNDMTNWTNGTSDYPLAGFSAPTVILEDSGAIATNTDFAAGDLLKFTFDSSKIYYLATNRTVGFYFSVTDLTNSFTVRANFPGDALGDGRVIQNSVGSTPTSSSSLDMGFYLDGVAVTNLNAAPMVAITSPTNQTIITAGSTTAISVFATDLDGSVARVALYEGTNKLGEVTNSPYNFTWTNNFSGTFSLTAKATDNGNVTGTSAPVSVTVYPLIQSPQYSSNFSMIFYGEKDTGYLVEYSTNLTSWWTLTNIVVTNGGITIGDSSKVGHRFYRIHSN